MKDFSNLLRSNLAEAEQEPPQPPPTLEETDLTRHREIMSKAVSAILLLTLKWFKRSRMLPSYIFVAAAHFF